MYPIILYILCLSNKDCDKYGDHIEARALPHQWTSFLLFIHIVSFFSIEFRNFTENSLYFPSTRQTLYPGKPIIFNSLLHSVGNYIYIVAVLKNCETPGHFEYAGFLVHGQSHCIISDRKISFCIPIIITTNNSFYRLTC